MKTLLTAALLASLVALTVTPAFGIDTVPIPDRPVYETSSTGGSLAIGTWPTPDMGFFVLRRPGMLSLSFVTISQVR